MIRRPLGRGLDALIEEHQNGGERPWRDGAPGGAGLMAVAIERIVPGHISRASDSTRSGSRS